MKNYIYLFYLFSFEIIRIFYHKTVLNKIESLIMLNGLKKFVFENIFR